jgi:hypothetical protein
MAPEVVGDVVDDEGSRLVRRRRRDGELAADLTMAEKPPAPEDDDEDRERDISEDSFLFAAACLYQRSG